MSEKSPFPAGAKVVCYVRDSGGDTQDLSVQQQINELKKFCAQNHLVLTRTFADEAKSGTTVTRRTAFQQMIDHFRHKDCQEVGVLVWNYTRFARNLVDFQFYIYDLQRRGYLVHALMDHVPEGPEGHLVRFVMAWSAQEYSRKLSEDARRGLQHLVLENGCVPGNPPPGFKKVPVALGQKRNGELRTRHKWEPDPQRMLSVKKAWELRAAGATYQQITQATHLYKSANCWPGFFRNKLYLGILEYGGLVIEGYCEPAITQETWDLVQIVNQQNKKAFEDANHPDHPNRTRGTYLLTGLVKCARCGSSVNGSVVLKDGKLRFSYYWCSRAKRRRDCDAVRIPKEQLEESIVAALAEEVLQPTQLRKLYESESQMQLELVRDGQLQQAKFAQDLASLGQKIERVVKAIEQAGGSEALVERLQSLEGERAQVRGELDVLEAQLKNIGPALAPEELERLAFELRTALQEADLELQRYVLRGFVAEIRVDRKMDEVNAQVTYYSPTGLSPPASDDKLAEKVMPRLNLTLGALRGHNSLSVVFTTARRGRPKKTP